MPREIHTLREQELFSVFKTNEHGLSSREAAKRLIEYGKNELPQKEKQSSGLVIFSSQWKSPLIYLLLIAAGISFFLGEYLDAAVIVTTAILNVLVGFSQEYKANRALEKLQGYLEHTARVLRDGQEHRINARQVVPGDILFLHAGDRISADGRLIVVNEFEVDESLLTGESIPVRKSMHLVAAQTPVADRTNMAFGGTIVTRGTAKILVTGIGEKTHFGEIATLVATTEETHTPLQREVARLGRLLAFCVVVATGCIFAFGLLQGRGAFEIFTIAVAVGVAAIPEGLVISLTTILAIGMQRILRDNALVRTLVSAETLGSVTVICTDKTGTLTEGNMRVTHVVTLDGTWEEKEFASLKKVEKNNESFLLALRIGVLCNNSIIENKNVEHDALKIFGEPTENALLRVGAHIGIHRNALEEVFTRVGELPFHSSKKYMATLHKNEGYWFFVKGAPEKILEFCSHIFLNGKEQKLTQEKRKEMHGVHEELTSTSGLRVIAVAYRKFSNAQTISEEMLADLVFVGFFGMEDPLREGVVETLKETRAAGIRPIMITGDHVRTAEAIGRKLGLDIGSDFVFDGAGLNTMDDAELQEVVRSATVFARVDPRHKIRIVEALKKNGEVVAMTGDGVNDAPALKAADIGVALGSGTDVAKETADMILLNNAYGTIVAAVKQGRIIFENIKKVVLYLLAGVFAEGIVIVGSLLLGSPLPLLAVQILWVNLIEDSLPNIALAFDPPEKGIMQEKPRQRNHAILDRDMKYMVCIIGVINSLLLFSLFYIFWKMNGDIAYARSVAFLALGVDSLIYIYSVRSLRQPIWRTNPFNNQVLNIFQIVGCILMLVALYVPVFQIFLRTVPLGIFEWTIVCILAIIETLVIELVKYFFLLRKRYI